MLYQKWGISLVINLEVKEVYNQLITKEEADDGEAVMQFFGLATLGRGHQ